MRFYLWRLVILLAAALLSVAGSETQAACGYSTAQLQALQQQIDLYKQYQSYYRSIGRNDLVTLLQSYINSRQQIINNCRSTSSPSGGSGCNVDAFYNWLNSNISRSRASAINYYNQTYRYSVVKGYYIYYSRGPIYQCDYKFTPVPRAYYVSKADAYRVIQQLSNNNNFITSIGWTSDTYNRR